MKEKIGKLFVVGIGPGSLEEMTYHSRRAIESSDVIVGYSAYINLAEPLFFGKVVISGGMGMEVERCEAALREALLGRTVALISSGDAGIYGMAGLVLEIAQKKGIEHPEAIEIIPGMPAFVAAASLVGAPLMNDFTSISLSDLMNPWGKIEKRLTAAASGDFVTCLYNPRSKKRTGQMKKAREIFLKHRSPETPVAIIRNAFRDGQSKVLTTLDSMLSQEIDMLSIVIIGNSETESDGRWMVTRRGYLQ
jgi:precorrin-3B C17-methyltransferase